MRHLNARLHVAIIGTLGQRTRLSIRAWTLIAHALGVGATALLVMCSTSSAFEATLFVGHNETDQTIQAGEDAAKPGDPCGANARSEPSPPTAAYFCCDATPPPGHPLCGGWVEPVRKVEAPLLAKGVVISDGRTRYVLCVLDWAGLSGGAHDLFLNKLAAAGEVKESQVAIHTTHTHSAPYADTNAQRLLDREASAPPHIDLKFIEEVSERLAAALRRALPLERPLTHVGYGKAKVEKFASSRRVPIEGGKVRARLSSTNGPSFRAAPEGKIDPWLRTITLMEGPKPIVRLHYYATHPQTYEGSVATPDTPGLARARLEQEEGIPQIYFTGCGGDIAAGKYNDGSGEARAGLIDRLAAGMRAAIARTKIVPVTEVAWRTTEVPFELRKESWFSEDRFRRDLADVGGSKFARISAAVRLAWCERIRTRPKIEISCLRLGPVHIVHLPGEPFVEYQLYAQALRPDDFVAAAGYGDFGPWYIPTEKAYDEGGYEPPNSFVGPEIEARLKAGIERLLSRRRLDQLTAKAKR